MPSANMETNLLEIITKKLSNDKKIKVIVIQGPSTSGKTTLTFALHMLLKIAKKTCYILNLDDFYQTKPKTDEYYDYESPSILQWEKIINVLKGLDSKNQILETYRFKFQDSHSNGPIFIDNPKPEYIIIEGLHSHYLFSDEFFCFDEIKSNKKIEEINFNKAFKQNQLNFKNFAVLKIALTFDKERQMEIRSKRDMEERNRDEERIKKQLEYLWQSTETWVYNYKKTKPHIIIENGSFNIEFLGMLKRSLLRYWIQEEGLVLSDFNESPFILPDFSDLINDENYF